MGFLSKLSGRKHEAPVSNLDAVTVENTPSPSIVYPDASEDGTNEKVDDGPRFRAVGTPHDLLTMKLSCTDQHIIDG